MSTSSVSSSTSGSTAYELTSLGDGSAMQVTGLASGLNTDQIISELMAIKQQPLDDLQNEQSGLNSLNSTLSSIQTALQKVASDAQALSDPTLFDDTQSVTSSDSTTIGAALTSGSGAGVGGYSVTVSTMATSAQRTFTYTSPTSGSDTFTVDGQSFTVTAGESIQDFAQAVNQDSSATVYAAVTGSGTVVLSDRQTGLQTGSYIQVSDPGGTLTEQPSAAYAGQDAQYTVNGVSGSSSSNTLTSAIPGVTLTLNGVTGSDPVTVDVGAPAPSTSNIESAIQQFVTDYNSAVSQIQTQLSTAPTSSTPGDTSLFGDADLTDLLSQMRSLMYTPGSGLSEPMATMLDIGVSTGATTGSGSLNQDAVAGQLTVDTSTLEGALQSNPSGVQQVLQEWSSSMYSLVNGEAGSGGTLDARIQGDDTQVSNLANQISDMQAALADQQQQLVNQYAQLESALSSNQSESSWLTSQIAQLP